MSLSDVLLAIPACLAGIAFLIVMWQLCLYKKVKGNAPNHIWFRYYNRFTGKISHEYWNDCTDYSGIQIDIWHKKDGFEWKISWQKHRPDAYDWWSSEYYEHTNRGFEKCDDLHRDEIVRHFLYTNGIDDD